MINSVHQLLLLGFVQGKTWKSREILKKCNFQGWKIEKKILIIIMEFYLTNLCNSYI